MFHTLSTCLRESLRKATITHHCEAFFRQIDLIPRLDKQTAEPVLDDLGDASHVACHDWTGQSQRLEQHHGNTLAQRGQDKQIHDSEDIVAVVSMSKEHDFVPKSAFLGECIKRLSKRAATGDYELTTSSTPPTAKILCHTCMN